MPTFPTRRALIQHAYAFEDLVADLFAQLGYGVSREVRVGGVELDLLVERDGARSPVEVSAQRKYTAMAKIKADAGRLLSLRSTAPELSRGFIVVGSPLTHEAKAWSRTQYDLEIWDLEDLRAKAKPYPDLANRLSRLAEDTEPASRTTSQHNLLLQSMLTAHINNNVMKPRDYEELCMSVFVELFDPHLYGFQRQAKTTDGGNRYDFICRIQSGNAFWDDLRQDFRTKAILFECKNYDEEIGPDQVYSTERYIFSGALRTVCFLIARPGPNAGAIRAAQGAMRESGKLVILLSNTDLVEMLKLKPQEGAAENFLDKRVWDFIVSLPR